MLFARRAAWAGPRPGVVGMHRVAWSAATRRTPGGLLCVVRGGRLLFFGSSDGARQRQWGSSVAAPGENLRVYTRGQVAQHNSDEDLWVIVDQRVYDLTEWANFHPGSREVLVRHAGCDATEYFNEVGHSDFARSKMTQFLVGRVDVPPRYNASEYRDRPGET